MERLIVLDTETTGTDVSKGDRVIEIGCCEIIDRKITSSEYHQYVKPNKNVGESVNIHGITDRFLANKPKFEKIADAFLEYIKNATLVIHNAPFDTGFLNNELKLIGIKKRIEDECKVIDTLELSKQQRPGSRHSLDALCRRFEIDASKRTVHGALIDTQILAKVYLAMTGGQSSLSLEINDFSKQNNNTNFVKVGNNRAKIKIVNASKTDLEQHNNYFKAV